jgi:hypothetical protein
VGSGVTLRLGNNVALRGRSGNASALVRVEIGGTLEMKSGSKISGNANASSSYSGGVHVESNGTFAMNGGEISDNTASGGVIYGVDADSALKNAASGDSYGHAVYVSADKKCSTTVGAGDSLDSTKSGAAGGWVDPMLANLSLDESLEWLNACAMEGGAYIITLNGDETIAPKTLSYSGKTVSVTLNGGANGRFEFKRSALYRRKRRNADAGRQCRLVRAAR